MAFKPIIEAITIIIEMLGVSIIALGTLLSLIAFSTAFRKREDAYDLLRKRLGRAILLGLEFLVAADIINTVAVEPTLQSVMLLGLIVIIRTFLSFSIEVELERRLPWQGRS